MKFLFSFNWNLKLQTPIYSPLVLVWEHFQPRAYPKWKQICWWNCLLELMGCPRQFRIYIGKTHGNYEDHQLLWLAWSRSRRGVPHASHPGVEETYSCFCINELGRNRFDISVLLANVAWRYSARSFSLCEGIAFFIFIPIAISQDKFRCCASFMIILLRFLRTWG